MKKPVTLIVVLSLLLVAAVAFGVFYFNYTRHHVAKQQADAIRTQITQPVALAAEAAVKQDVTSEVIAAQAYISSQGANVNYAAIPTHASVSGETIVISPNGSGFTIVGTYAPSGFTYRYDSVTGSYS